MKLSMARHRTVSQMLTNKEEEGLAQAKDVQYLVQVVKSQMAQEAEVMKQSMARQESMSQMLTKEEEEATSPTKATSPTFKPSLNANRPSMQFCYKRVDGSVGM